MTQPFGQNYHLPGQQPRSTNKIYMSGEVRDAVRRLRERDPDPDLKLVLDQFWEELKPIPFGFLAIDSSDGTKWTYVGMSGDRHEFIQEHTRKSYRANQTSTLVTKFPNLKEFAV